MLYGLLAGGHRFKIAHVGQAGECTKKGIFLRTFGFGTSLTGVCPQKVVDFGALIEAM
jgi:hypothetical protein